MFCYSNYRRTYLKPFELERFCPAIVKSFVYNVRYSLYIIDMNHMIH